MNNSKVKKWTKNNKLLIFSIPIALSLFVSTVALATTDRKPCNQFIDHEELKGNLSKQEASEIRLKDKNYYRLPRTVEPKNYRLTLHPNMNNDTFDGSVMITIRVKQTIQTIMLHSNNLTIHAVNLKNDINQNISILNTNKTLDKRELLIINLEHEIHKENYKLFILFSGRLDNKIVGIYGSRLKNGGLKLREDMFLVMKE